VTTFLKPGEGGMKDAIEKVVRAMIAREVQEKGNI